MKIRFAIAAALLLMSAGGLAIFIIFTREVENPFQPRACTMEAKLCPDGSSVGRTGPNCGFAPCPGELSRSTVKLFYYHPEKDKDEDGQIMCSSQGLISVEREIPTTQTPIKDTINLLLSGDLAPEERIAGIETEFPLEGLSLTDVLLRDGIVTLEFKDPFHRTVGGSCRVRILWVQIEATAKQFPEVREVHFLPEELFQP